MWKMSALSVNLSRNEQLADQMKIGELTICKIQINII